MRSWLSPSIKTAQITKVQAREPRGIGKRLFVIKSIRSGLLTLFMLLPAIGNAESYERQIRPFLDQYCVSCHGRTNKRQSCGSILSIPI